MYRLAKQIADKKLSTKKLKLINFYIKGRREPTRINDTRDCCVDEFIKL